MEAEKFNVKPSNIFFYLDCRYVKANCNNSPTKKQAYTIAPYRQIAKIYKISREITLGYCYRK